MVDVARCRIGDDLVGNRVPYPDVASADIADGKGGEEGVTVGGAKGFLSDCLSATGDIARRLRPDAVLHAAPGGEEAAWHFADFDISFKDVVCGAGDALEYGTIDVATRMGQGRVRK